VEIGPGDPRKCYLFSRGAVENCRDAVRLGDEKTVVWLTVAQTKALARISKASLAPVSALVRQAVNVFLLKRRKGR
jgi:hypothetical protein